MNKPKSTVIELDDGEIDAIHFVRLGRVERVSYPGKFKVYRKNRKIYLEVFHND